VTQQRVALGTADEAAEVTTSYRANGQVETLTDGENNRTTYVYDGHDRLLQTLFPHPTKGAGVSNAADYEQLSYDPDGNVTSRRLRDGQVIGFTFDALDRVTLKDLPNTNVFEWDVSYAYDNLGRMTQANDINHGMQHSLVYDALGRLTSETSNWYGTRSSAYDAAGRRTRLTWRDGFSVDYDHLVTGEVAAIRENGATSGIGVLATFGYDDLGRRTSLTRGNGTITSYGYDPASRLTSLAQDLAGSAYDLSLTFSHNPALQIVSNTRSNDLYAWTGHGSGTTGAIVNGLNQLTVQGATALSHDARGNMTFDGSRSFGHTAENRMTTINGALLLAYDPLGRLYNDSDARLYGYDPVAGELIEQLSYPPDAIVRRYVPGPGMDEPLVWYEGSGAGDRRFLHADERGSIVAVSDSAGNAIAVNRYDEYGKPQAGNLGRFQYTGQVFLPEIGSITTRRGCTIRGWAGSFRPTRSATATA
jgi:YD repeat-containing protein